METPCKANLKTDPFTIVVGRSTEWLEWDLYGERRTDGSWVNPAEPLRDDAVARWTSDLSSNTIPPVAWDSQRAEALAQVRQASWSMSVRQSVRTLPIRTCSSILILAR